MKIPLSIVRAATAFSDWTNVPVYRRIIRLDILLAIWGIVVIAHGWYWSGWWGALLEFLTYVLVVMISSWIL